MQSRVPLLPLAALALLALATMLILPATAGLGGVATPTENNTEPEFTYTSSLGCTLEDGQYSVAPEGTLGDTLDDAATGLTVGVEPLALDGGDGIGGGVEVTFSTPTLEGGDYAFIRECPTEKETTIREVHIFSYSRILLVKETAGTVPDGATFTVQVSCTSSDEPVVDDTRIFEADGGSDQVVFYPEASSECSVTETDRGGADTVTVEPSTDDNPEDGEFVFETSGDMAATVTNTFSAAEPEPEPSPTPTDEVEDTVEEAEPAEPVVVEPDFTG